MLGKRLGREDIIWRESEFSLLKVKDQAIASPFSEYISHLQTVQIPEGNRNGVWPASHTTAFEWTDADI